jgi:hypothetical protein
MTVSVRYGQQYSSYHAKPTPEQYPSTLCAEPISGPRIWQQPLLSFGRQNEDDILIGDFCIAQSPNSGGIEPHVASILHAVDKPEGSTTNNLRSNMSATSQPHSRFLGVVATCPCPRISPEILELQDARDVVPLTSSVIDLLRHGRLDYVGLSSDPGFRHFSAVKESLGR